MNKITHLRILLLILMVASAGAQAVPGIPEKAGWSGIIGVGVGAGRSETNMEAAIASIDLGNETISSLSQSPDDESLTMPVPNFEVAYTFADMTTQIYLNNQMADHATFDLDTSLLANFGVRQELGEFGIVDFSLGGSSIPVDVWKDPYLEGEKRGDTERTLLGIQVIWGEIFGSGLELALTSREIDIDDERSGQDGDLALSSQDERLLRRKGQARRLDLLYNWKINDRHHLVPGVGFLDNDLDGDAMAEDGPLVQLKHLYDQNSWSLVSTVFFQKLESDTRNPIYNKQSEVETLGGSITLFRPDPFGLEGWTAHAGAIYYEGDSNIDFYDSSFGMVSVGAFYRFD
jgi:hypothetical protein